MANRKRKDEYERYMTKYANHEPDMRIDGIDSYDDQVEARRFERDEEHLGVDVEKLDTSADETQKQLTDMDASAFNSSSPEQPKETDTETEEDFRQTATAFRTPIKELGGSEDYI